METRTKTPEPLAEAPAPQFVPPPRPTRSALSRFGWTLRDYAKRVWDNAGEDNVLFLAGGIAFNILLAAVPFVLLLVWGVALALHNRVEANQLIVHYLDRVLPAHYENPDAPQHKLIGDILGAHTKLGIWSGWVMVTGWALATGVFWMKPPKATPPSTSASAVPMRAFRFTLARGARGAGRFKGSSPSEASVGASPWRAASQRRWDSRPYDRLTGGLKLGNVWRLRPRAIRGRWPWAAPARPRA